MHRHDRTALFSSFLCGVRSTHPPLLSSLVFFSGPRDRQVPRFRFRRAYFICRLAHEKIAILTRPVFYSSLSQTFASEQEAQGSINGLNDQDLDGRRIRVNLANSKPSGGGGGYGGGGYGGGGGGGGCASPLSNPLLISF